MSHFRFWLLQSKTSILRQTHSDKNNSPFRVIIAVTLKKGKFDMKALQRSAVSALTKPALLRIGWFMLGALVSRGAVFGAYAPFGVAFTAAVPYEGALYGALGSSFGYIMLLRGESFRCVASVITVFALRWLFSDLPRISENRLFAPLCASLPLLCTGSVIALAVGRGKAAFAMCLLEALLAGVGAYFLHETAAISAGRSGTRTFDQQEVACIVMTGCIFLLAANSLSLGGISLGRILAVTAILFCSYYGSVAGGCIGGTAAGIVFGVSAPEYGFLSLSYGFGGLMAGVFSYAGKIGSAAAFMLCSAVVSLKDGVTTETAAVFYETVAAALLFLFIPKEAGAQIASFVTPRTFPDKDEAMRRGVIMRLDLASKAISGISEAVGSVAQRLGDYYGSELEGVFARSIDESCSRCGMRAYCERDGEETHLERMMCLEPILKSTGEIEENDVKRVFTKRCCRAAELARSLSENYESYKCYLAAKARAAQVRGVVAGQFAGLSEILGGMKEEFERYESCDLAAGERISAALRTRGILALECSVRTDILGRMTVELELADENRRFLKRGDVCAEISRLCGRRLQPPKTAAVGNRVRVTLSERPKLDVQVGSAQHCCGGGRLCGDSLNYFNDGCGRFVAVISDGMGTGGRAAVDGSMAVSIISRLVKAGLGFDASLGAANAALMVKSEDESLATADILSLDLFSGDAEIMKAGAPVTFVRRSGRVVRVEPSSLPAGILPDVRLTHDETTLGDGDLVVMLSDGAIAMSDEWIGAMVRDFEGEDVQELVNDIIDEAMIGSKFGRDDDITVLGVRVVGVG